MTELEINAFFDQLADYEQFNQTQALDYVHETVDTLLQAGDLTTAKEIFDAIDINRHTVTTLLGFMSSSKSFRDTFSARNLLLIRLDERVRKETPEQFEELLANVL